PISGGAPWTIGYGCTGAGITRGVVWTMAQAEAELAKRVQQVEGRLQHALPWFATFQHAQPARADVLVNMAYNLGIGGLLQFDRFLAAMRAGQWSGAVAAMRLSAWAGQVGDRARRLEAVVLNAPAAADISASQAATRAALEA
ncbi:MAG: glycoside hydrolase family protein, partial [Caulobacteraceae bacterium]